MRPSTCPRKQGHLMVGDHRDLVLVRWLSKHRLPETTLFSVLLSKMPLHCPGDACELLTHVLFLTVLLAPSQSAMPHRAFSRQRLFSTMLSMSPLSPRPPTPFSLLPTNLLFLTL